QVAGLKGSLACIEPRHDGPAMVIASTLGPCPDRASTALDAALACALCRGDAAPWTYQSEGDHDLLRVPLRDTERHYGMLRLVLVRGQRLEGWQRQLVEALSRHMGMALGAARRSEQERLLGLQEERSVIARELHDSLAQALSYMKIQVSLLQPLVGDPARSADALTTLADLREGVNAAYRQLRELLVSFRLKMTGDFPDLLQSAVEEYASKGKVELRLETRLAHVCNLSMRAREWSGELVFLHEAAPGAADRSYGVQVAKLAGVPPAVVTRAREVLDRLEGEKTTAISLDDLPLFARTAGWAEPAAPPPSSAVEDALRAIEPDELSPREALEALYRLKGLGRR
ncbi:MAG: hypothetical protein CVU28_15560, partial [Betaproteobacteria bacterium HGW-Betaproteobacteria-21]